jgi:hypothetical protein
MPLDAPQVLEAVHQERGGDHHAAKKHMPGNATARRRGRRSVESSQRDHLEILAAKTISVQAEENKKIPGASA